MLEYNELGFEDLIEKEILDKYFKNIREIQNLKEKERILLKELERNNYLNKQEMNKLEEENKNIEAMIQNMMQLMDKDNIVIDDNEIVINKIYKVSAKRNRKDSLINYINNNGLPIRTWQEKKYDIKDLTNYLISKDYTESYHNITKEIEVYIDLKKDVKVSIKKIEMI